MEYNKKEQLLDKINGLRLTSTNASDTIYNRGVVDAFRRTNEFFDEELIPEVPQYVADWYESNKKNNFGWVFSCEGVEVKEVE